MPLVCAALLVSLLGGAVWWVSRGTEDDGVAPKTSAPQNGEKEESLDEAEREREKTEKQFLQEILDEFRKANANNER